MKPITKPIMKPKTQLNLTTNKQAGLTLIEIMIAITLSLFLLGGLLQLVSSNKQTYRVQDAMARVQENGRFSLHFLSKDIRMAGFMGCSNTSGGLTVTNNVKATAYSAAAYTAGGDFDGNSAVVGLSYTTGTLPTELSSLGFVADGSEGSIMPNTDALFLRRAESCPGGKVAEHNNNTTGGNSAQMKIEDNSICNIQQDDIVMVSNCETADIFGVSNVVNSSGGGSPHDTIAHGANKNNAPPTLSNGYGADSFLFKMKSEVYYIGVGASGQPALFKRELAIGALNNQELVEGIEGMTILYGEDRGSLDGTADAYVTAANVFDMENVVSIRITATARTLEDNIATTESADNDYRIRRSFTTTIGIRNRIS